MPALSGSGIRLFEPTGQTRSTVLTIPVLGLTRSVTLGPSEIKTFRFSKARPVLRETDLLEQEPWPKSSPK
jgi:alpha-mannosidase